MTTKIAKLNLIIIIMAISACVFAPEPGYYDGGPAPYYGAYGYGPIYPWDTGIAIDLGRGYGHGGYVGRGGYGRGRGGVSRGGGRR